MQVSCVILIFVCLLVRFYFQGNLSSQQAQLDLLLLRGSCSDAKSSFSSGAANHRLQSNSLHPATEDLGCSNQDSFLPKRHSLKQSRKSSPPTVAIDQPILQHPSLPPKPDSAPATPPPSNGETVPLPSPTRSQEAASATWADGQLATHKSPSQTPPVTADQHANSPTGTAQNTPKIGKEGGGGEEPTGEGEKRTKRSPFRPGSFRRSGSAGPGLGSGPTGIEDLFAHLGRGLALSSWPSTPRSPMPAAPASPSVVPAAQHFPDVMANPGRRSSRRQRRKIIEKDDDHAS